MIDILDQVVQEKGFIPVDGPKRFYPESEDRPYITLCVGGVKEEGGKYPGPFLEDPTVAFVKYVECLSTFLQENPGKYLVWRIRPKLVVDNGKYQVRSRQVTSNTYNSLSNDKTVNE